MSLGSLLLKFRSTFQHGVRVAYWRDVVRKKILQTAPVTGNDDLTCEIHVLSSSNDWLNLVWMLKSFYRNTGKNYALCVHDDGTLTDAIADTLQKHFPDSRIIRRAEADAFYDERLNDYPKCMEFRYSKQNNLALKVFDFYEQSRSDRIFIIDSDVLFFEEPKVLIERIEDSNYKKNTVNADCQTAYSAEPEVLAKATGLNIEERYNSGLGLIHKDSIKVEWVEEFLGVPGITEGHHWRIEQTLYALCSFKWGFEHLPEDYSVRLEAGIEGPSSRHYVGAIRHLMYVEGMRRLVKEGILK